MEFKADRSLRLVIGQENAINNRMIILCVFVSTNEKTYVPILRAGQ